MIVYYDTVWSVSQQTASIVVKLDIELKCNDA